MPKFTYKFDNFWRMSLEGAKCFFFHFAANKAKFSRFRVALDMEQCLDRFYGGYFSGKYSNEIGLHVLHDI